MKHLCFRCHTLLLKDSKVKRITFYQCPKCLSAYSKESNKPLHDRWRMPLSLVLYGVIFDKNPLLKYKSIAIEFSKRDDLDLDFMISDIKQELEKPRQNVSHILDFEYPDEVKLREFLQKFEDSLSSLLKSKTAS